MLNPTENLCIFISVPNAIKDVLFDKSEKAGSDEIYGGKEAQF